jgi:hypothetical protein
VARVDESQYLVVSPTAQTTRDFHWIKYVLSCWMMWCGGVCLWGADIVVTSLWCYLVLFSVLQKSLCR